MKIQGLAIIFIIIILPISMLLAEYTQNRVTTLSMQANYDSKLNDVTYDALKAYQLNSFNSDTSDYVNSRIRNINASVKTFFNSLSSSFGTLGYTKETLQNYIPAIVYTMYDGYYIYSPYTNTWDAEAITYHSSDTSYHNGEKLYGLKPYIYYSCRYRKSETNDITITYSLDNYIQIQGILNGKTVSRYGYLLNDTLHVNGDNVTYNGVQINREGTLYEYVYVNGKKYYLPYLKKNGTKYYYDNNKEIVGESSQVKVFSILNGKVIAQSGIEEDEILNNKNAIEYYKEAYNLQQFIKGNDFLNKLTVANIKLESSDSNYNYYDVGRIFDFSNIELETSNFNTHRIEVIKHSIERNLSIAISNYNDYSIIDFKMPKLKENDWDKIMKNISIMSFMQGVNIGGKIYNGYSLITNNNNEDIVMEESIYIKKNNDNNICRITEENLTAENTIGIYNVDIERRIAYDTNGNTVYFFPVTGTLSYDSLVTQNGVSINDNQSLYQYILGLDNDLKKVYYTALGRERYGLYRARLEI